jgi:hypothetical protein
VKSSSLPINPGSIIPVIWAITRPVGGHLANHRRGILITSPGKLLRTPEPVIKSTVLWGSPHSLKASSQKNTLWLYHIICDGCQGTVLKTFYVVSNKAQTALARMGRHKQAEVEQCIRKIYCRFPVQRCLVFQHGFLSAILKIP